MSWPNRSGDRCRECPNSTPSPRWAPARIPEAPQVVIFNPANVRSRLNVTSLITCQNLPDTIMEQFVGSSITGQRWDIITCQSYAISPPPSVASSNALTPWWLLLWLFELLWPAERVSDWYLYLISCSRDSKRFSIAIRAVALHRCISTPVRRRSHTVWDERGWNGIARRQRFVWVSNRHYCKVIHTCVNRAP